MYFSTCTTTAEVKTLYRRLAMQHHPDRGGNNATMQAINTEYHATLLRMSGETVTGTDGRQHTYHYNQSAEQAVMNKIGELVGLGMVDVEILLIGSWIWITGNTKPYKAQLGHNGVKCRWHSKREAWYWHVPSKRRQRYNKAVNLDGLAAAYGCKAFDSEERQKVTS